MQNMRGRAERPAAARTQHFAKLSTEVEQKHNVPSYSSRGSIPLTSFFIFIPLASRVKYCHSLDIRDGKGPGRAGLYRPAGRTGQKCAEIDSKIIK